MTIALGQHEPGSEGWDDARRLRLGGSEVAAVLGLSPWASRLSLWLEKKGLRDPQPGNAETEWGQRLEDAIRAKFVEDHPGDWTPNPGMFCRADRRWQIANPDALASDDLAEIKHPYSAEEWGPDGTDEVPVYYRAQVLWYVDTFDLGGAWLAALIGHSDYRVYRIERDASAEEDIQILREAGHQFITDLINDRMPDIDRHSATYQAVRELHPDIQPGAAEIDVDLAGAYLEAYIAEKAAEADKAFYGAQILGQLGSLKDATARIGDPDRPAERFAYRTARSRNGQPGVPYLTPLPTRVKQLTHPKTIREAVSA